MFNPFLKTTSAVRSAGDGDGRFFLVMGTDDFFRQKDLSGSQRSDYLGLAMAVPNRLASGHTQPEGQWQ